MIRVHLQLPERIKFKATDELAMMGYEHFRIASGLSTKANQCRVGMLRYRLRQYTYHILCVEILKVYILLAFMPTCNLATVTFNEQLVDASTAIITMHCKRS